MSSVDRRGFLLGAGAVAAAGAMGIPSAASAAGEDWRALVFIHFGGGVDGNALLLPTDASRYADFTRVRPSGTDGSPALSTLLPFTSASGDRYGVHPSAPALHNLVQSGEAAFVANVGPIQRLMTRAELRTGVGLPRSLFSHSDQVDLWQTLDYRQAGRTGFGGRLGDWTSANYGRGRIPAVIAFSRDGGSFILGARENALVVQARSNLTLCVENSCGVPNSTWGPLLEQLSRREVSGDAPPRSLRAIAASDLAGSISLSQELGGVLAARSPVESFFVGNWTGYDVAQGLLKVAKVIEQRARFGLKRQIFLVSVGGWDTHNFQEYQFANLVSPVSQAVGAFQQALRLLGVHNNVVTATISDFGRTFRINSNGGTDHGWGNHMMVVGGPVASGGVWGRFPQLQLGGADDLLSEGRWIPSISSDQYFATLASWLGVPDASLPLVVPNIGSFGVKNLGFLRST